MSEIDRDKALRLSIRDRVLRRATEDEEFRKLLIDNPKAPSPVSWASMCRTACTSLCCLKALTTYSWCFRRGQLTHSSRL
jgi:hypothetical protein